ncbi:MAG: glycosyltransferase [Armatimonadota bacterium]
MCDLPRIEQDPSAAAGPRLDASVVVCTYNRRDLLVGALESIRAQTVKNGTSWEVLVVDNGCTDGTWDVLQHIAQGWELLRPLREPRPGKSFALNTAIRYARGEVLAFTDDDVVADRNWLISILDGFRRFEVSMAGGRVLPLWEADRPAWYREPEYRGVIAHWDHGERPFLISDTSSVPSGNNLAVRADVVRRYGGFHTGLGAGRVHRGADSELGIRLFRAGERIAYLPGAVVYHRVDQRLLRRSYVRRWCFRRGIAQSIIERPTETGVPKVLRVPRWRYRVLLETVGRWVLSTVRGDPDAAFFHETRLWMAAGFFAERWSNRFRNHREAPVEREGQRG